MSLPKIALAGTAALALSLSLGACSLSINGSGSDDSGSPAATQAEQDKQTETKNADSDDDKDGDDVPITDASWKDIQSKGQRTEVSGDYTVQGSGTTLNLVGDLNTLTVQGSDVKIAAEDVDTLTVQGSNVTVYARDIDHLTIQGSGVTVRWLGDDPEHQDLGSGNTIGKLNQ